MIHLIDFEHYLQAARMIWQGISPYGRIEFFAPPWMALLVGPFLLTSEKYAELAWMLLNVLAINASVLVSIQWIKPEPLGRPNLVISILVAVLLPAALFSYITGQVSPLVALAALILAREVGMQRNRPLLLALGVFFVSLKPHIIALPILLIMLELVRQGKFKAIAWFFAGLLSAGLFGFITNPQWPADLLSSWLSGDYFGGKPGLVSPGYTGLVDFGIPTWVFAGFVVYILFLWYRNGLSPEIFSFSLTANLLLLPYRRSYDDVLLILPLLFVLLNWRRIGKVAVGLVIAGSFGIPWTPLSLLSPVFIALGALLARIHLGEATG